MSAVIESSVPAPVAGKPTSKQRARRRRTVSRLAHGEPMVWLMGGALVLCLLMIAGLLGLVSYQGLATFWPQPLVRIETVAGRAVQGEPTRVESYRPESGVFDALDAKDQSAARELVESNGGASERRLVRTGNNELTGTHFTWVSDFEVAKEVRPEWALVVERLEWGRFYGVPVGFRVDGEVVATDPAEVWERYLEFHPESRERFEQRRKLETVDVGRINHRSEGARLELRAAELDGAVGAEVGGAAHTEYLAIKEECEREYELVGLKIRELEEENERYELLVADAEGREVSITPADVVRAYPANQLSLLDKVGVYLSRWAEFLLDDPREANSEGGVYPAIFGTIVMTLLMTLFVVPFGVLGALYLREYAKQGLIISAVRIAVNNLAGVPSIVFGVFGLGFFCYLIGASIDDLFHAEKLPSPTFGKGGVFWASLTLALLTLPVVIVATEEALAAVPGSMREGSYACGATKWQTIWRIVLPRAAPGIMTGMILAIARGAGEVAPLMLVGASKLAADLPIDGTAPFIHPSRSFMHLGFHIFDLGFHSQNSEAAKPMVYTTTFVLIAIVVLLNVAAIVIRSRLRKRFQGSHV